MTDPLNIPLMSLINDYQSMGFSLIVNLQRIIISKLSQLK